MPDSGVVHRLQFRLRQCSRLRQRRQQLSTRLPFASARQRLRRFLDNADMSPTLALNAAMSSARRGGCDGVLSCTPRPRAAAVALPPTAREASSLTLLWRIFWLHGIPKSVFL
jgi:hypothetical protein